MRQLLQLALIIGIVAALATACGGRDEPTSTVVPAMQTATAAASAEAAYERRPPCVLDRRTLLTAGAIADTLRLLGEQVEERSPDLAREYEEAATAYRLVSECRVVGASPSASPAASMDACPPGADAAADRLRDAWTVGVPMVERLLSIGISPADLAPIVAVNDTLIAREAELRAACGLAPPGTAEDRHPSLSS